jgi:hypothetical protein
MDPDPGQSKWHPERKNYLKFQVEKVIFIVIKA